MDKLEKYKSKLKLWGFENLLVQQVFLKFLFVVVTFDMMLGRYICWT